MTEAELTKLLAIARGRPLKEAETVRKGERKGERYANLRPETVTRLERLGWERALIYKTLVLTGLRKGELASLTVGQVYLDGSNPYIVLHAADEKSGEGNSVPLRSDLVDDLRGWLAVKLGQLQADARRESEPVPLRLPATTPIFEVPDKLSKILTRDLIAAKIAKKDERGHVLDIHALRHTFGTLLSKGGVSPRTAQAAMRHSKIDLTMNVYTDPRLMDVSGALDALPGLPLNGPRPEVERLRMTGTDAREVVQNTIPDTIPTPFIEGQKQSNTVNDQMGIRLLGDDMGIDVTSMPVNGKGFLSTTDRKPLGVGVTGLEPVTPSVSLCRVVYTLVRHCSKTSAK
jgi:hypothetical protein